MVHRGASDTTNGCESDYREPAARDREDAEGKRDPSERTITIATCQGGVNAVSRGGGGDEIAIVAVLLIVLIVGPSIYYADIAPFFATHRVTLPPVKLPTVGEVVTMVTDAYGHASA